MNNAYLKDIDYINLINETIDKCLSDLSYNTTSHQTLWDYCKVLIKEKSIYYAKMKSKERKNLLFSLETELSNIINSNETNEQTEIRKQEIENKAKIYIVLKQPEHR